MQDIQVDLADFINYADVNDGYIYIYIYMLLLQLMRFQKSWAVPVKDKKPQGSVKAVKQAFEEIGIPGVIYHGNGFVE